MNIDEFRARDGKIYIMENRLDDQGRVCIRVRGGRFEMVEQPNGVNNVFYTIHWLDANRARAKAFHIAKSTQLPTVSRLYNYMIDAEKNLKAQKAKIFGPDDRDLELMRKELESTLKRHYEAVKAHEEYGTEASAQKAAKPHALAEAISDYLDKWEV